MKTVGITGGIASGKSIVCKIFEHLGTPVYYADIHARIIMLRNEDVKKKIQNEFGEDIYIDRYQIDKEKLAKLIFEFPAKREILNSIVHPAVLQDMKLWKTSIMHTHTLAVYESALLFESGFYKEVDYIVTVVAPMNERIQRIITRDGCTEEFAVKKIESQIPQEEKAQKSHFVINNEIKKSILPVIFTIQQSIVRP
ncbi:MAG: dephospho-CoA kinase [Bacteroidales bacterium]